MRKRGCITASLTFEEVSDSSSEKGMESNSQIFQ